ncbi:hypothetical protein NDU88_000617 [Pleurodeles waltl]|uniref:Uncharacterized protein n=1 Tax=Pleurodeles waltl TaxID=8319 RepID=A0AAV7WK75_PLEWA|nr:hypothetical protein NDU88_000617 [Pleurodeles waltl]
MSQCGETPETDRPILSEESCRRGTLMGSGCREGRLKPLWARRRVATAADITCTNQPSRPHSDNRSVPGMVLDMVAHQEQRTSPVIPERSSGRGPRPRKDGGTPDHLLERSAEPTRAALLEVLQGSRRALEGQIAGIFTTVKLLQADLRKMAEKVGAAETNITALQSNMQQLQQQVWRLDATAMLEDRAEYTEGRSKHNNICLLGFTERSVGRSMARFLAQWVIEELKPKGLSKHCHQTCTQGTDSHALSGSLSEAYNSTSNELKR